MSGPGCSSVVRTRHGWMHSTVSKLADSVRTCHRHAGRAVACSCPHASPSQLNTDKSTFPARSSSNATTPSHRRVSKRIPSPRDKGAARHNVGLVHHPALHSPGCFSVSQYARTKRAWLLLVLGSRTIVSPIATCACCHAIGGGMLSMMARHCLELHDSAACFSSCSAVEWQRGDASISQPTHAHT